MNAARWSIMPGLVLALSLAACREASNPVQNPPPSRTANLVASDVSAPTGPGGASVAASGTMTFSGLTVELWNGQAWFLVANAPTTATIEIGDGSAAATLMPSSDVPAGEYTRVRLTVTEVTGNVVLEVDGQRLEAQVRSEPDQPLTIEKTIEVTANPDGSRTFRVELQLIRTVTLTPGAVILSGDVGALTAPATIRGSVVASDVSNPTGPDGRPVSVSGTATFTGLTVELWDGETWRKVTDGEGSATVELANGSVTATLVPAGDLPAGTYTRIRVSAVEARIDLTVAHDGEELAASLALRGQFAVEKSVEVIANSDGSRTLRIALEMIRTVAVDVDPGSGEKTVTINGDFGTVTAPASRR